MHAPQTNFLWTNLLLLLSPKPDFFTSSLVFSGGRPRLAFSRMESGELTVSSGGGIGGGQSESSPGHMEPESTSGNGGGTSSALSPGGEEPTGPRQLSPSHSKSDRTPLGRVLSPPKLERKHSSGDLHSRLKTRKMLGVGETDNGDIHRSKISQVLGHNEHLYLKLPRGYWNWQAFLAAILAFQAVFILIFPQSAGQIGLVGVAEVTNPVPSQYYAATMLGLSYMLWKFLNFKDKGVTRTTLLAILIHFSSLCLVDIFYALLNGLSHLLDAKGLTMMALRGVTLLVSLFYLSRMGTATSGLRKSPSYKDVSDNNTASCSGRRE